MTTPQSRALRAELLKFEGDPGEDDTPAKGSVRHIRDGALWIKDGRIRALDHLERMTPALPEGIEAIDHRGKLIMPGFIASHVHYVQLDIMASYGRQLLDWLNDYAFPEECRFASHEHGEALSNAFFSTSRRRDLRMLAGKVKIDRLAPDALCDDTLGGIRDTERLIGDWHGKGRMRYSLTPRFAPTCSRAQLDATGGLMRNDPSLWLQTHLAENTSELDWVGELFPDNRDYLEVYEQSGLVGPRSTFAHGVHLDNEMRGRLAERGANLAF